MAKSVTVIPASQTRKSAEGAKKKIRVAAYCRVSTEHEEQIGSFENQVSYYTELINNNPDWVMAGIFSDEGISGTGTKKRQGFQNLIQACREGKVDRVITKSISRFARNTADCLHYSRELKDLGIPIYFQKENIDTMAASGELLFTILSSLAQEESRNISENTTWGIRSKFKRGQPMINTERFMGYDKDENGNLVINPEQAKVVERIFQSFLEGWSLEEIAQCLKAKNIPGVTGKAAWNANTIRHMLQNEKYKGDLLMQKTYTLDFLSKKMVDNNGEKDQYYVQGNHKPIISPDNWEAAQYELKRREGFMESHGIREISSKVGTAFFSKVFCGNCGARFVRKNWTGIKEPFWKCYNTEKAQGKTCNAEKVKESALQEAVVIAWNSIVENRDQELPRWEEMEKSENPLERLRGKQMIELTAEGRLDFEVPELTRMVLQEITVHTPTSFTITFLDGTVKNVRI
ncbi:MAG: recombinase family protein [Lachnospiraceae bacterium]